MLLKITSIADRGVLEKERIVMKAASDTDIGRFAIFRCGVEGDQITTIVTDTFWLPNMTVRAGDLVVLYSKVGKDNERVLKSGATGHFFYWGRTTPLWGSLDHAPVLVLTREWESYIPEIA